MTNEHEQFRKDLARWAGYLEELSENANFVRAFQKSARVAAGKNPMSDYWSQAVTVKLCADNELLDEVRVVSELLRKAAGIILHYENTYGQTPP